MPTNPVGGTTTVQAIHRAKRRLLAAGVIVSSLMVATVSAAQAATSAKSEVASAKTALAPYTGHPSAFPVTQKLHKKPPASTNVVFLQCGAAACANIGEDLKAPTSALGVHLTVINAGLFPSSLQSAAEAALALHPAAVIIAGVALSGFGDTLAKLESAGIIVDGIGIVDGSKYGLKATIGSETSDELGGALMADWVLLHKGKKANVVFFGAPELDFSPLMWTAFDSQLRKICPTCSATTTPLSVLTYGSSAPGDIVSYLRAHPAVNTAVFPTEEGAVGLPAALDDAGLSITTFGFGPTPANLADIENGSITGGLGLDVAVEDWTLIDVIAKQLTHQSVPAAELKADLEVLGKSSVTAADVSNGWTGYPNVAKRFASLWP